MKNPWIKLSRKAPFALMEDKGAIGKYNRRKKRIYLDLPPDPFIGDINSDVVLLNGNPGYEAVNYSKKNPVFIKENRRNLLHQRLKYPFYAINPKFRDWQAYRWWVNKLGPLMEGVNGTERLSRNVCCFELIGYHSKGIPYKLHLHSQKYTKYLVEKAIKRKAIIVIMRVKKEWCELVPDLKNYPHRCDLKSPQNVTISPNNLPQGCFEKILNKLKKHHPRAPH